MFICIYNPAIIYVSCLLIYSRDTSATSVICSETEEIESVSTKKKKMPEIMAVNEATSSRKQSPAVETPCAAELEEFFSKAEQYDHTRFAEK